MTSDRAQRASNTHKYQTKLTADFAFGIDMIEVIHSSEKEHALRPCVSFELTALKCPAANEVSIRSIQKHMIATVQCTNKSGCSEKQRKH